LSTLDRGTDFYDGSVPVADFVHVVHNFAVRSESLGQVPRTSLLRLPVVQRPHCLRPLLCPPTLQRNHQLLQHHCKSLLIKLSNNLNTQANPMMAKMQKYVRFFPFFSLPITIFFPSGLVLYWNIMALTQLFFSLLLKNEKYKSMLNIPQFLPGTILEKMVY
jgi:hypothetical protein